MTRRFRNFSESKILLCLLLVCTLAAPADGISISCSSTAAGESATSRESFTLDDSTSLHEVQAFNSGRISINRQAEGKGNNSIQHTIYGKEYALQNSIESQGEFAATSSTSASAQSATMNQNMGGSGSLSLELMGREGARDALQEARVNGGSLVSSQSLTAGHGISARQSTEIRGQEGSVLAGALGSDNVVVARGSFEGLGSMKADLGATTQDQASIMGTASIDGVPLLSDHTFRAISGNDEGLGMGMSGLRMIDGGLGNFDMSVISSDLNDARSRSYTSKEKSDKASGGSSSSYALTGFRWNEKNPNIQLHLNPSNIPPGIKAESARDAISAAASTWDEVVDKNLFKDESTVIIDYNKEVPNPFSGEYRADGINMNGFRNFGNNYLAVSTYWTDLTREDGYYSLIESDLLYNLDFEWTDDLKQAENTGKLDLQSVAVHELGHTIGLEDLYILDSSDSRKYDFEQVMNLYDGPQRTLGNGDRAGAQELYGVPEIKPMPDKVTLYRMYNPDVKDHFYTTNPYEYNTIAVNYGYLQEGILGFISPINSTGTIPLYRMYSPTARDHFYTTDPNEYRTIAVNYGYIQEGKVGYIYASGVKDTVTLYRMYSATAKDHFYTSSLNEYSTTAVDYGYNQEGAMGYIYW